MVTVVVCLIAGTVATTIAVVQVTFRAPAQPITIKACTAESWDAGRCSQPFFGDANDDHPYDQPIVVAGEVCNETDEPIGYIVNVEWVLIGEVSARFPTLTNTDVVWNPGCRSYSFPYTVPDQLRILIEASGPGADLGRWKIVGRADPINPNLYRTFVWDVTGAFTLTQPGE